MKTNLLVLFGGESSEHDVSILSARNVVAALDHEKYDIRLGYITVNGKWTLADSVDQRDESRTLVPQLGKGAFTVSDGTEFTVDVLFPVLHGQHGEDGDVQGLANLLHVPCVGPSLLSAAVTMDKDMTKRVLAHAGIPVTPWHTWYSYDPKPAYKVVTSDLGEDVFIKPNIGGSSVGVSHVTSADQWDTALDDAAKHADLVLIEKTVHGREIELAVLGNARPEVTSAGEIIPGEDFYSFEDKYNTGSTAQTVVPAELPAAMIATLKQHALDAYRVTASRGMSRVDFLLDDTNTLYLNEINSIPGFTDISMYPKLWQHEGLSYSALLDRLIALALE
ncbi:MAG TPA: D-alanine--D-alanine ligase family protein [Candidatus Saccharimonadales bacterium]|jgi:D-alanine-D-alanine ligase